MHTSYTMHKKQRCKLCTLIVAAMLFGIMLASTLIEIIATKFSDTDTVIIMALVTCILFMVVVVLLTEVVMEHQLTPNQVAYFRMEDDRL